MVRAILAQVEVLRAMGGIHNPKFERGALCPALGGGDQVLDPWLSALPDERPMDDKVVVAVFKDAWLWYARLAAGAPMGSRVVA